MQWLGAGLVVAASVSLITAVLHLLVGWPGPAAAVAACATAAVPLAVIAAEWPPLAPHGGQVLVQAIAAAGSSAAVAVIYLVIVLGLGETPADDADRKILGFSMLAAAVAAVAYLPVRGPPGRVGDQVRLRRPGGARRGAAHLRQPADPGRGHGRAAAAAGRIAAQDDAPGQRGNLHRQPATCWSVPCRSRTPGRRSIVLTDRERPVVARAGVSGSAWASVWLPSLLDGREQAQLRVAPISHGGELLGLIVAERPAGPTSSPRRTTGC